MTPKEILIAARAKIEAPERWTHGAYARDAAGRKVEPTCPDAVRWCVRGAIDASTEQHSNKRPSSVLFSQAVAGYGALYIPIWNDAPNRTHAEVLAAFDRAIAAAELEAAPTP
jgi:hypothetical protein